MYTYDETNRAFYEKAYDILIEKARAPADEKESFVLAYCQVEYPTGEYRFRGSLGFGGKFRRNMGRFYVTYYPEDETPRMKAVAGMVNTLLKALAEEMKPNPKGP